MTRLALQDLQVFNENPTPNNASRLVTIPTLYNLLQHEENVHVYRTSVILLCKWVYERGMEVLEKILVHKSPPEINLPYDEKEWMAVSACNKLPTCLSLIQLDRQGVVTACLRFGTGQSTRG